MLRKSVLVTALFAALSAGAASQTAAPDRITIMPMANASRPADLDFQGGGCELSPSGTTLDCMFQQVFITPVPEDHTTCRIVTNRYAQTFRKQDERRWISREGPSGPCGTITVTTLERDEKSLPAFWRVTMNMTTSATNKEPGATAQCSATDAPPETLTSTTLRRALGCTFITPGSLEF